MYPKSVKDTAANATHITITHNGDAVPPKATISIQANEAEADFNASYMPCTLTFIGPNGCPFQNCSNNKLSLSQGHNIEKLNTNVAPGLTYSYTISPPPEKEHRPMTSQYDITVSS